MSILRPAILSLTLVALALPAAVSAAPASTSFKIVGYEYAFTSRVGSFAGSGTGDLGDRVFWNAIVKHDRLGSVPTYVNGGTFAMTVLGADESVDAVAGTFTHHGGTITTLDRGANCTNQRYLVSSALEDVTTTTTSQGTGRFAVTLTHYRKRIFGRCVAYKARVAGTLSLTY